MSDKKINKQALANRRDGYVTASEVARATFRELGAVHADIASKKIPGCRIGWGWYVDIHKFADANEYPEGTSIRAALEELRKLVDKPATHVDTPAP